MLNGAPVWLAHGVAFGLEYNPIASVVACAVAAAIAGRPRTPREQTAWAVALLLGAWVVADGLSALVALRQGFDSEALTVAITFAVVSLGVGYALPAMAGVYVGRHVTRGTGRQSALVVAASVAIAFVSIAPPVSAALIKFGGSL